MTFRLPSKIIIFCFALVIAFGAAILKRDHVWGTALLFTTSMILLSISLFVLASAAAAAAAGAVAGRFFLRLTVERMRLGAPDASGRARPEPTGETVDLVFDAVVQAIGEKADLAPFPDALREKPGGWLAVGPGGSTADPAVFVAGGDSLSLWILVHWERPLPAFVEERLERGTGHLRREHAPHLALAGGTRLAQERMIEERAEHVDISPPRR